MCYDYETIILSIISIIVSVMAVVISLISIFTGEKKDADVDVICTPTYNVALKMSMVDCYPLFDPEDDDKSE